MRYHRTILRRSTKIGRRWVDSPGYTDFSVDFGFHSEAKLKNSLQTIREMYEEHRIVKHFAIPAGQAFNGQLNK